MEKNKKNNNSSYSLVFGQWLQTIKEYAFTEATTLPLLRYIKLNSCVIIRNLVRNLTHMKIISKNIYRFA